MLSLVTRWFDAHRLAGVSLLVATAVLLAALAAPALYWRSIEPWSLEGFAMTFCPCDTPCPCRSGGKPTHGGCQAATFVDVVKGHYGPVRLDGIRFVTLGEMHRQSWGVVYAEQEVPERARTAMLAIAENMMIPRSFFAPLFLPFARPEIEIRPVDKVEYEVSELGALRRVTVPGVIELYARMHTDEPGVPRRREPAVDLLSNWIVYADNLIYRVNDSNAGQSFDLSGRQASFTTFRVSKQDYDQGRLFIQHLASDSESRTARQRILDGLRRSGELDPKPLEH